MKESFVPLNGLTGRTWTVSMLMRLEAILKNTCRLQHLKDRSKHRGEKHRRVHFASDRRFA